MENNNTKKHSFKFKVLCIIVLLTSFVAIKSNFMNQNSVVNKKYSDQELLNMTDKDLYALLSSHGLVMQEVGLTKNQIEELSGNMAKRIIEYNIEDSNPPYSTTQVAIFYQDIFKILKVIRK